MEPRNDSVKKLNILMLVPRTQDGGLANYCSAIKKHFHVQVDYFERGKEGWPNKEHTLKKVFRLLFDYIGFVSQTRTNKYTIIHLNVFFSIQSLIREAFFVLIAKASNKKVIVFYRGWSSDALNKIEKFFLPIFKLLFFQADAMIVLSSAEKRFLQKWGYTKKIYLETTTVNDELVKNVIKEELNCKYHDIDTIRLLFLSRIDKAKGIYETIEAYRLIKAQFSNVQLVIAGVGPELKNVKKLVNEDENDDIKIIGFVQGKEKISSFKNSHIYVFPSYSEGLPNSVLEAFAFGLPVVTRPVGGLVDVFNDGVNGYITESKDPKEIAKHISQLIRNPLLMTKISLENYDYANKRFRASIVAKRLEKIYFEVASI